MSQEPRPHEEEPGVESGEPPHPDSDAKGEASPTAPAIIPGNVGSLDDVPSDVMEEDMPTINEEGLPITKMTAQFAA